MLKTGNSDAFFREKRLTKNSGYSNSKKQNVATHELGHALGLDHSTSTDVMDAAITGHTSTQALSQNDKDSYDAAYNNY